MSQPQVYDLTPDSLKGLCAQLKKAKTTPQTHKTVHVSDSQLDEMTAAFNAACAYFKSLISTLQERGRPFQISDAGLAAALAIVLQEWGDGSDDLQQVITQLQDSGGSGDGPTLQHP
jgi:hypothetical protein